MLDRFLKTFTDSVATLLGIFVWSIIIAAMIHFVF